jgi:glycosyltransferase involved in cell wall biosynthesis
MKVLWFSNTPALGADFLNKGNLTKGTGGWLYSLNTALQAKVDLSISFHYPYNIPEFVYQKTNFYPIYTGNIIIENLKKRILGKIYDVEFLGEYLKVIEKVKPDIIHIHGTENSFLCLFGNVNVPIVVSIQGNLNVYYHKFLEGFHGKFLRLKNERINLKTILFGRKSFHKGHQTMGKMAIIERKHLGLARYILGRTEWDRRITSILAPESKYYIGNEMLREAFYKYSWNNPYISGKLIIFTTNSDNYYKGFETLCYALSLLVRIGIEIEWRVAGVDQKSLINKITKKYLKKNYPKTGLVLLGPLDEQGLIKNMLDSHIYVMPSHIENSPNNLCEAMILGMPCIATYAGGTGSLLKDGEEGILVQNGDPWAMAGAILELRNNQHKAVEYGQKARARALIRHDKDTIVNQLIQVYQEIIENS